MWQDPAGTMAEALLIVDFQQDFTPPAGALAVPHGDEIAARLNELARDRRLGDAGRRRRA
jgi:nicotinamidase-related amidase